VFSRKNEIKPMMSSDRTHRTQIRLDAPAVVSNPLPGRAGCRGVLPVRMTCAMVMLGLPLASALAQEKARIHAGQTPPAHPALPGAKTQGTRARGTKTAGPPARQAPAAPAVGLETVTVTANRRAQDLQKVAGTVTAISRQTITRLHLDSAVDIAALAPNALGYSFDGRLRPRYYIRGVGNGNQANNAVGAVALYADDVYLNNLAFQGFPLFDLAHVEVLNGPQGTLWGKNATAGAIQFISQRPTFRNDGYAQTDFGNYGQKRGELVINTPVVKDRVATRLSVRYEDQDGWAKNQYDGKNVGNFGDFAARFQVLGQISENADVLLSAHVRDMQSTNTPFYTSPGTTVFSPLIPTSRDWTDTNVNARQALVTEGISLHVNWRLGHGLTFTSISSFDNAQRRQVGDTDYTPQEFGRSYDKLHPTQASQEIRLASDVRRRISWILGAYYFHEHLTDSAASVTLPPGAPTTPAILGQPGYSNTTYTQNTDSVALFGNTTLHVTKQFQISGGVRWTYDDLHLGLTSQQATSPVQFANTASNWWQSSTVLSPLATIDSYNGGKSWSNVSYEVEPQYLISDRQLVYVRIADGYRSGIFNTQVTPNPIKRGGTPLQNAGVVNPETLTSYELGYKSAWLNRRLTFNLDGFYSTYNNMQVSWTATDPTTKATILSMTNAASGRMYGGELAFEALPLDHLSVSGNLGLLKTEFTNFTGPTNATNLTGNEFARAPHETANLSVDWRFHTGIGDGSVGTHWNYTGHYYYLVSNETAPALQQRAVLLGDVHAAFHPGNGRVELGGVISNITGDRYLVQVLPYSATTQRFAYAYGAPRMFLLSAKINFF
jgi:iron complex outermembrane recepter protein